jgi:N-methylhydantoinase B/oxoprolinase/acetone carboxylase alpha subunit
MGQPILRDRETPFEKCNFALLSKGNLVNIPEPGGGCYGNVNELRDTSKSPRKSYLFFLTVHHHEISLTGEMV